MAHKTLEEAEHAAQGGGSHNTPKTIGLTIALIAVLIAFCAAICVAQLGRAYIQTRHTGQTTGAAVSQAEDAYQQLRQEHVATNEDEKTVEQLDPGGKIRAAIGSTAKTESKNAEPGESPSPH